MSRFQASEPVIYPSKDANYKDKNGNDVEKWFIRYTLKFDDAVPDYYKDKGRTQYRREFGSSYNISLKGIKKLRDREDKAAVLLGRVKADLESGIDPEYREYALEQIRAQRAKEAIKYGYDRLVELFMIENNYVKPIPKKELSANAYKSFFNNQLKNYLISINKTDDIRVITTEDIETFLDQGKRGELQFTARNRKVVEGVTNKAWNSTTTNVKRGWISALFSIAVKKRLLLVNPVTIIPKTKTESKKEARFKVYSREEIEIMFSHFKNNNLFLEATAKMLYYAYVRRSELFRLKLWMIDLDKSKITIPADIAKGQRDGFSRVVHIYPILKECLTRWIDLRFNGDLDSNYYLFPGHRDIRKQFDISNFNDMFNAEMTIIQRDNQNHFKVKSEFYSLKHTSVTRFIEDNLESGNSTKILLHLKNQLRHEDFSTTQKYLDKDLGLKLDLEETFVMN